MNIIVAGPGCGRCHATEKIVVDACAALNLAANVSHEFNVKEYFKLGVRLTPAVIVDGKVVVSGKIPTVDEMKKILSECK